MSDWAISSQLIIDEAEKMGIKNRILSKKNNFFLLEKEWKKVYFKSVDCWLNSAFWLKISNNKELTYIFAESNDIRVPKSIYIDRENYNSINLENLDIDFPVISKPVNWAHWDWVSLDLNNFEDLKRWLDFSFQDKSVYRVVVQEQIEWEDHRIIVLNWKVEAVTKRIPPYVKWDWNSSIKELIDKENNNPLRWIWGDHDAPMSNIKVDSELEKYLEAQWYSMDYVLEKDKEIFVRQNANLSSWWLALDLTDIIHPEVKKQAEKIATLAWLWFCWVDFFCKDISMWIKKWWWAIIEINATPWIRMHHFPSKWKSRNLAKKIIEAIF